MSYDTTRPTRSIVIANTDPRTDVERIASLQRELAKATDQVCSLLDTASAYKADAERLRKAIETALRFRIEPLRVREALQAALIPPTAASGQFGVCMICGADLTRSEQCLACDKCEPTNQAEPKRAVTPPRTSCQADAAESVGDAPPISSSAPAAESEGGVRAEVFEAPDPDELFNQVLAARDKLSARLAACEERCKELEAGIERHRSHDGTMFEGCPADRDLWSLLAPKAGGEDNANV